MIDRRAQVTKSRLEGFLVDAEGDADETPQPEEVARHDQRAGFFPQVIGELDRVDRPRAPAERPPPPPRPPPRAPAPPRSSHSARIRRLSCAILRHRAARTSAFASALSASAW